MQASRLMRRLVVLLRRLCLVEAVVDLRESRSLHDSGKHELERVTEQIQDRAARQRRPVRGEGD